MQHSPSQVSSGNIAPNIVGPQKDTKDVVILVMLILFLGGLLAAAWYYGQAGDQLKLTSATEQFQNGNVTEVLRKVSPIGQADASTANSASMATSTSSMPDLVHADIYFEVGRKGLTDEAKTQLATHADMLKQSHDYGVLILGYTDQQGSAAYNKQLGLKRGEAVKAELLQAGVAEQRMKVVSLGEEGVLCVDSSDVCRHMNRRVHLEIRKIGQEHMTTPAVAESSVDLSDTGTNQTTNVEIPGSSTKNLVPLNSEPVPGS